MVSKNRSRCGGQGEPKKLIAFVKCVPIHSNFDGLAGFAGGEGKDTIGSHIVGTGLCIIIISRIVDSDHRACRSRQGSRQGEVASSLTALGDARIGR